MSRATTSSAAPTWRPRAAPQGVIEQYDGSPAEQPALAIMLECYRRLGFTELARNVERVYAANYPASQRSAATRAASTGGSSGADDRADAVTAQRR